MTLFRVFLVSIVLIVGAYTLPVIANHGMTLYAVFFGDIAKMAWPGQFNLDFLCFLAMSGTWLAWRHHFSPGGLLLGVGGLLLGAPYLAIYLLIHSFRVDGDLAALFLGPERAANRASG